MPPEGYQNDDMGQNNAAALSAEKRGDARGTEDAERKVEYVEKAPPPLTLPSWAVARPDDNNNSDAAIHRYIAILLYLFIEEHKIKPRL